MAYVVVTLFDRPDAANEGMQALEEAGFSRTNMECIESDPDSQSFLKRLFITDGGEVLEAERAMNYLRDMGIPQGDADMYAQRVRKGQSMVILRSSTEDQAERARGILYGYSVAQDVADRNEVESAGPRDSDVSTPPRPELG